LARAHQASVFQNQRVDDLPAEDAFPSPKPFSRTAKLVGKHGATATMTFHYERFSHHISSSTGIVEKKRGTVSLEALEKDSSPL
jgi:hypothetical protein